MATQGNGSAEHQAELLKRRAILDPLTVFRYFDDFVTMPCDDTTNDPLNWEIVQDGGGTAQIGPYDSKGGWFNIACDGDDNDEAYASSQSEAFIFNTTDKVYFEARVSLTAGSTDGKGSFVVGLSDTVAADSIVDAGTLMTSFDGAVFHKNEDAAGIGFTTSNATSQTTTASVKTWTDGDTVRLGFVYDPNDAVTAKVTPLVDGSSVLDSSDELIQHSLTISGLQEMHILLGVKTHEGAEQQLLVDWVHVVQER